MRRSTEVQTTSISFLRELEIFRLYDFSNNVWALRSMWTQLGIELCYQLPWTWIMIQLWDYGNPSIHQHVILPPDFRNIFTSPIFAHWSENPQIGRQNMWTAPNSMKREQWKSSTSRPIAIFDRMKTTWFFGKSACAAVSLWPLYFAASSQNWICQTIQIWQTNKVHLSLLFSIYKLIILGWMQVPKIC